MQKAFFMLYIHCNILKCTEPLLSTVTFSNFNLFWLTASSKRQLKKIVIPNAESLIPAPSLQIRVCIFDFRQFFSRLAHPRVYIGKLKFRYMKMTKLFVSTFRNNVPKKLLSSTALLPKTFTKQTKSTVQKISCLSMMH